MTAIDPCAVIRLADGDVAAAIAPRLGGALLRLSLGGVDLLRPADDAADDVLAAACFPLLPFANRIAGGRLRFDGETHVLDPDPEAAPHALHGHGWRAAWQVLSVRPDRAVLAFEQLGGGWPWRYRATQTIELLPAGVRIGIDIENLDPARAMPAGAGIHPYFTRDGRSAIAARATRSWLTDERALAIREVDDVRFAAGSPVRVAELEGVDSFFRMPGSAPPGKAIRIVGQGPTVRLSGEPSEGFHVYVPVGGSFFCVEPVSHAPNAYGRGEYRPQDAIPACGRRRWRFDIVAEQ